MRHHLPIEILKPLYAYKTRNEMLIQNSCRLPKQKANMFKREENAKWN